MKFDFSQLIGPSHDKRFPNIPVQGNSGYTLSRTTASPIDIDIDIDIDIQITATQNNIDIRSIMTGYLYMRDCTTLEIETANLNSKGIGKAVLESEILRGKNPVLIPFPARIRYEFSFDITNQVRTMLSTYLINYYFSGIMNYFSLETVQICTSRLFRDVNHRIPSVPYLSNNSFIPAFLDGDVGIYFDGGRNLISLANTNTVIISAKDLKSYSAYDEPLSVIPKLSSEQHGLNASSGQHRIDHVYKIYECDSNLTPLSGATDYKNNTSVKSLQVNSSTQPRFVVNHDDFKDQLKVVVHFSGGPAAPTSPSVFEFDRYEKTALHPTNLDWHFRNWYVSGYLRAADRTSHFVTQLLSGHANNFLYPANSETNVKDFPSKHNIAPPAITVNSYADSESWGTKKPTYNLFEIQKLKFRVKRQSTDTYSETRARVLGSNINPSNGNRSSSKFIYFHYSGTDAFEAYIKRVATTEYNLGSNNGQNEVEGFKAQLVAARSYFLERLLRGGGSLKTPFELSDYLTDPPDENDIPKHDYDEQEVVGSAGQTHLKKFNYHS